MFKNSVFVGSGRVGRDGRVTIPIEVRELLELNEGNDKLIFYVCENETNNEKIIIIERGEKKWD